MVLSFAVPQVSDYCSIVGNRFPVYDGFTRECPNPGNVGGCGIRSGCTDTYGCGPVAPRCATYGGRLCAVDSARARSTLSTSSRSLRLQDRTGWCCTASPPKISHDSSRHFGYVLCQWRNNGQSPSVISHLRIRVNSDRRLFPPPLFP
jgi:hypothetical protein